MLHKGMLHKGMLHKGMLHKGMGVSAFARLPAPFAAC
jgi:hypothetical protein